MTYETLIKAIDTVPVTQLLGLYLAVVKNIIDKQVFKDKPTAKKVLNKTVDRVIKGEF